MVERETYTLWQNNRLALRSTGIRSDINTICIAADDPPVLTIAADDTVFLDLGPVFDEWEADVGRPYALGSDPHKHCLCADLEPIFEDIKR